MLKKGLQKPQFSSTMLVQDIVMILKQPPFNENLTLMSFDEKKEYELLEIIMKVLQMIDEDLKISKNDNEQQVLKKILDFLKVVNFPYSNEKQLEDDLNKAEKRLLIQIIHFTLTKLNELKKRYYLSKFLNNINIPDELNGDEEIIDLMNEYRELQSEFQSTYQLAEEKRTSKPQLKDLKDEIKKLQSDKIQLNNNISSFQKNYSNKPEFQALFESTSKLRKEQEEDSNLEKRLYRQKEELEELDNRLMVSKQRHIECSNSLKEDISAIDMLSNLRNQRDKNRETVENLSRYELIDKKSKLRALEEILIMPEVSYDMLNSSRMDKKKLEAENEKLDSKVKATSSKTNEITIYKNNAINALNAKEQSVKHLEKCEKEKLMIENKYSDLERKFEMTYGHRYVKKDDLLQQIESIKKKKELFNKCNKIIESINDDNLLLDRTVNILKNKTEGYEKIIEKIEQKYGFISFGSNKKELEELTRKKKDIDQNKEITLEEYSKLIQDFKKKIENTYSLHTPLIDQQLKLKQEFEALQPEYNKNKNVYESQMLDTLKAYNNVKDQYIELEKEYAKYQNEYHTFNIQIKLLENQIKRYELENSFQKDKRLNKDFKNFTEYYKEIMSYQAMTIKDLDVKKNVVRENSQDNFRQIKFFNDMKKLLAIKKNSLNNSK